MSKWRVTRIQYSFGLGILVVTWTNFPSPRALFVLAIVSLLTALRFNALGWKVWKAFIPLGIAAVGVTLGMVLGAHGSASKEIAHLWRGAAVLTQLGMTVRAALAWAECDPRSARMVLLQDTMAKRRSLIALGREAKPIQAERERAFAEMMALHEELRLYGQRHGFKPGPEQDAIRSRMDAQQQVLDRIRAVEADHNEKRRQAIESLNEATKALKGYRRAA